MFYRRKIILALLEAFGGQLEKIPMQKLLFLFSQQQAKPDYYFIPYKYGCFSYSATADLSTMVNKGILIEDGNNLIKSDKGNYLNMLNSEDKAKMLRIKEMYHGMDAQALMKLTYLRHPYYAINSVKAKDILSREDLQKVRESRPVNDSTVLYTIGYEGVSVEEYLNKLIKHDIQVLVDVRRNPLSMKYGFSKSHLKRFCESIAVQYLHFPEVGIDSSQRRELNCQKDYDLLFESYKSQNLSTTRSTQISILEMLKIKKRIALTCFESNICQCHRKHLAEAIALLPNFEYQIKHI